MKRIISLFLIVISMIALSGCFATDTTTLEFVDLPDAIYAFSTNPSENQVDLTKVTIRINGGEAITLQQAISTYGVTISGNTFTAPGNHTLKIKYQSATITYIYRVEGQGEKELLVIRGTLVTNMTLAEFRDAVNAGDDFKNATVQLLRNVDLGNVEWVPIGVGINDRSEERLPFSGTFEGNGFTISGLKIFDIDSRRDNALFGYVKDGIVRNLTLEGTVGGKTDYAPNTYFAGFVAWVTGNSTLENLVNYATVDAANGKQAAGIAIAAGYQPDPTKNTIDPGTVTIKNCVNYAEIKGGFQTNSQTGGILATTQGNFIMQNCVNYGNVWAHPESTSVYGTAGLIGILQNNNFFSNLQVQISECINYGQVTASTKGGNISGLIGKVGTGNATTNSANFIFNNLYSLGELIIPTQVPGTSTIKGGVIGGGSDTFLRSGSVVTLIGQLVVLQGQGFMGNSTLENIMGSNMKQLDNQTFVDAQDVEYIVSIFGR